MRVSSITKNAGKACNNRLYRHIRTFEKIIKNYFVISYKIKYKGIGIRIVYTLVLADITMNIVVISERDDNYCYDLAFKLYQKYGDKLFENIFFDF